MVGLHGSMTPVGAARAPLEVPPLTRLVHPAPVPTRRKAAAPPMAELVFFSGTMDCGKSTLALQIDHNHTARGRRA